MALRFLDSFDHYATADLLQKWSSLGGSSQTIQAASGRRGGGCLRLTGAISSSVAKTLDNQATWVVGFALNVSALPSVGTGRQLVTLIDNATTHVVLRLNNDGTLSVLRSTTVLATSVAVLAAGGFSYIELKATIDDTVGAYEVRLNGATILAASGVDTRNGGNASANRVELGGNTTPGGNYDYDDLYICDTTSAGSPSVNADFLGDVRVDASFPNGNGNSSQFVGSDGNSTDNYLLVDEASQDGDTTYVQSSTVTEKDTYAFGDISHTPVSIFGVQINMIAKKDDAGARSIASVTRSGGADTNGATQALSTSYVDYLQIVEQDPNTAAAWTKTALNAAEFGHVIAV